MTTPIEVEEDVAYTNNAIAQVGSRDISLLKAKATVSKCRHPSKMRLVSQSE